MPTLRMPTTTKVVALSILLFIEAFIAGVLPITQEGNMPNEVQFLTITLVSVVAVVTYLIAQIK
jgi:hypothetical protein